MRRLKQLIESKSGISHIVETLSEAGGKYNIYINNGRATVKVLDKKDLRKQISANNDKDALKKVANLVMQAEEDWDDISVRNKILKGLTELSSIFVVSPSGKIWRDKMGYPGEWEESKVSLAESLEVNEGKVLGKFRETVSIKITKSEDIKDAQQFIKNKGLSIEWVDMQKSIIKVKVAEVDKATAVLKNYGIKHGIQESFKGYETPRNIIELINGSKGFDKKAVAGLVKLTKKDKKLIPIIRDEFDDYVENDEDGSVQKMLDLFNSKITESSYIKEAKKESREQIKFENFQGGLTVQPSIASTSPSLKAKENLVYRISTYAGSGSGLYAKKWTPSSADPNSIYDQREEIIKGIHPEVQNAVLKAAQDFDKAVVKAMKKFGFTPVKN